MSTSKCKLILNRFGLQSKAQNVNNKLMSAEVNFNILQLSWLHVFKNYHRIQEKKNLYYSKGWNEDNKNKNSIFFKDSLCTS